MHLLKRRVPQWNTTFSRWLLPTILVIGAITAIWADIQFRLAPTDGKIWNWLDLLIIPVVLGAGAIWFNWQQRKADQATAEYRAKTAQDIETKRGRQQMLQGYLDSMGTLINDNGLESDSTVHVIRARTTVTMRALDWTLNKELIAFLQESGLTGMLDDSGKEVKHIRSDVELLKGADLSESNLSNTQISKTDLSYSKLVNANLSNAFLIDAYLKSAQLKGANLQGAELINVNLENANLTGARSLTAEQLAYVHTLYEARMDEKLREEIEAKYPRLLDEPRTRRRARS